MQLMEAKKTVSSTCDAIGKKECAPEKYRHRIIFMGMMTEVAVADDYAGSFGTGYWTFAVPGSENTCCPVRRSSLPGLLGVQILSILQDHAALCGPSFLSELPSPTCRTSIKTKGDTYYIHCNASEQSISMLGKLIESVNHLCILFATIGYTDDLPEQTLDTARKTAHRMQTSGLHLAVN